MDKNKQPGISFDGIMLVKESFWRDYNIPDEPTVAFNIEMNWNEQDGDYAVELITTLILLDGDSKVLTLASTFIGIFSTISSAENMPAEQFLENHSAGLMFPYIREHISTITQKAGIRPILLPPLNIISLIKEQKGAEETKE